MTTDKSFSVIDFNQFGSKNQSDRLLLFAAPAKEIASRAGIPRKGWRIRMLFQRSITPGRENELKDLWKLASNPSDGPVSSAIVPRELQRTSKSMRHHFADHGKRGDFVLFPKEPFQEIAM